MLEFIRRVPAVVWAALAGFVAASVVILVLVDYVLERRSVARMDHFGEVLGTLAAELAAGPMLRPNPVAFSNLGHTMMAFDEVVGFSVYDVDDRVMVFMGRDAHEAGTVHHTSAVTADEAVVGYARVVLDRERFRPTVTELVSAAAPFWLLVLAGTLLLVTVGPRVARTADSRPGTVAPSEVQAAFVLVINLFDRKNVEREQKGAVLGLVLERADQVANIYGGKADPYLGTGVLVVFDDNGGSDRCFEVICAALLTARVLGLTSFRRVGGPRPTFRFGLHRCGEPGSDGTIEASEEVREALLLSALAADGKLAVSEEVFARVDGPEKLEADMGARGAMEALSGTSLGGYRLVHSAVGSYGSVIERQAQLFAGRRRSSTSRADTR
ncbi:MAG: hypothetical protein OXP28_02600 [Gammaproteobacteria bacterium]|nr:hypothetical protein [Gammaproteobacteria bacterium]MDE0224008.1 hypothetical protein [Gammaproteobacteria bacterium]